MAFFKRKEKAPAEVAASRLEAARARRGRALPQVVRVVAGPRAGFGSRATRFTSSTPSTWASPAEFHADAQRVLSFPAHYSKNLASWIDCIAELPVPDESGMALVFRRYDAFAQRAAAACADDSRQHRDDVAAISADRPALLALVQSDDPRIRFERVGAMPVTWNPREWLDADRGIGGGNG